MLHLRPDSRVGRAEQFDNHFELLDLGAAGQERLVQQQLAEDAASGPYVDGRGVCGALQQQLRRPVPQRHHARCHRSHRLAEAPRQSKVRFTPWKITNIERVKQKILPLKKFVHTRFSELERSGQTNSNRVHCSWES